ncbi:MAG TPA: heavy metal-responsive transcriptional regulator [Pyrinomonadaceae bacterium]|nr:heavy metal-responsive transcriptional regulator [Pyrinomonadaceae bacterium]
MNDENLMFIGELASAAGISCDTVRHYERKGVIARPKRAANGYRLYPAETLERVQTVRRALAIGFTLDELARLFRERNKGNPPCRAARDLAAAKLADLERHLKEMLVLRQTLRAIAKNWDARLSETANGNPALLLETISGVQTAKNSKFRYRSLQKKAK